MNEINRTIQKKLEKLAKVHSQVEKERQATGGVDNSTITRAIDVVNSNLCNTAKVKKENGKITYINETQEIKNWYTIEQLAYLCGYEVNSLKYGESNLLTIMNKMNINLKVNTQIGGYHNTQKFYSENVLKEIFAI